MDEETADYVLKYFGQYMTKKESLARTHHIYSKKNLATKSPNTAEWFYERGLLSRDPAVLRLLEKGYVEFAKSTADRILKENEDEVFLNKCPKCDQLARTPKAKQCRQCGYDWH